MTMTYTKEQRSSYNKEYHEKKHKDKLNEQARQRRADRTKVLKEYHSKKEQKFEQVFANVQISVATQEGPCD